MTRTVLVAVSLTLAAGLGACRDERHRHPEPVVLQQPVWVMLGERAVDFRVDHDRIDVPQNFGRFQRVQFLVRGASIEVYNVRITMGDGTIYQPGLKHIFTAESASRVIELPGGHRHVRRIDFLYRTLPRSGPGKAVVQVLAN